jgi:hypothetical protein
MKVRLVFFVLILLTSGCSPTISLFDQYAYQQTTAIKVDTHDLMQMATDDYRLHSKEIGDLDKGIRKIYEYDKNRPKNEKTVQQWDILMNPGGGLLGGFLKQWKDQGRLDSVYIAEKVTQIGKGFDQIIYLEIGKNKSAN